ncbi:hypothetical protein CDN99_19570 [Roseateles aquatilis]|uniref:DUF917 domain-containing protein n=1 Tax=Roseateles aquatilis TaxID=431061 RepID=A0A246J2S9_9BURK|nr:DUF917 family protein [Roseateles aquatilis]OWQ86907.1 hypothetical protein CDN99_19570 [Roseateles aquatilis]
MKRKLTEDDVLAAVWGGAILGGGGGGFAEDGERMAQLALQLGTPELWTVDEFNQDDLTATVAYVGAPGAPDFEVLPAHFVRALELLRGLLPTGLKLMGLHTNENGAETTVNGWVQSAQLGLPVLDLACNGRAHPSSLMGALGLHRQDDYVSLQAFAGGAPSRYVEGTVRGRLDGASSVIRHASVAAGGAVAVARNPVTIGFASRNGAPGAISHAIKLGRAYLDGGLDAVSSLLKGSIVAEGVVTEYRCEQVAGLDVGVVGLDDSQKTSLPLINEYMLLERNGRRVAAFPDLITTFSEDGKPVPSARVRLGDRIRVLHAPASSLLLSRTMFMPELYAPLEASLGEPFHFQTR